MDRTDIIDTCTRMAWYADRREWSKLSEVFADEVTLDYTSLNGGQPVTLTPAQIIGGWEEALGAYAATHHLLGNHLVTQDGDDAVCTATFQATHRKPDNTLWILGGTYRFDLVRRAGAWRITGVVMNADFSEGTR